MIVGKIIVDIASKCKRLVIFECKKPYKTFTAIQNFYIVIAKYYWKKFVFNLIIRYNIS